MDNKKKSELEGLVQKWQGTCKKARRHAEACYAEAQAKASEAEEATAQVSQHLAHPTVRSLNDPLNLVWHMHIKAETIAVPDAKQCFVTWPACRTCRCLEMVLIRVHAMYM